MEVFARPIPSYSEILKSRSRAHVNGLNYEKVINPFTLWDFVSDDVKKIFKPTQKNVHIDPEKKRNFLGVFEKDFPPIDSNTKREKGKPPVGKKMMYVPKNRRGNKSQFHKNLDLAHCQFPIEKDPTVTIEDIGTEEYLEHPNRERGKEPLSTFIETVPVKKSQEEVKANNGKCSVCSWTHCKCNVQPNEISFMDSSEPDFKLKGGGRATKVKVPKLRIVKAENESLEMMTNMFRSLFPYWYLFDSHESCKFKENDNCVFCSVRSIALRMNEKKKEPSIQPRELLTECFSNSSMTLESLIEYTVPSMAKDCPLFREKIGIKIQCLSCNYISKVENCSYIKCNVDTCQKDLKSTIQKHIEEKIAIMPS